MTPRWQWQTRRWALAPDGTAASATQGYAALPVAVPVDGDDLVVVFTDRDADGRSRVRSTTLDSTTLTATGPAGQPPLLEPGPLGGFDDRGCSVSCVVVDGDRWRLYYTGWSLGRTVPFYLFVGAAESADGGRSFTRLSPAPILDRDRVDPFLCASPWVLHEPGRWRMWYVSAVGWEPRSSGPPRHHYLIKYAESADGVEWHRTGHVCLGFSNPQEHAFGRPCVVRDGALYRMWFCVRGASYRIGYAESEDGLVWARHDAAGGAPARGEWDREMQAYPCVIRYRGRWLMLYNGDGYGATGFGIAESAGPREAR